MIDFIGRFEHRERHLAELSQRLGLPIDASIWSGSETRKDRRPYTVHYNAQRRAVVESYFRRDLRLLGYRFGEPAPTDVIEAKGATSRPLPAAA